MLKVMLAVLKLMTMLTSMMSAMKLSIEMPRFVSTPPLAVVRAVRLLVN